MSPQIAPLAPRSWHGRLAQIAVVLVAMATLAYGGAVAYLKVNERSLIFRTADRRVSEPDPRFALHERRVGYPSSGEVTLSAWIVPAAQDRESGMWMLICHGNYGNIGFGQRPEFYSLMRDLGVALFAFDYRGYGESTGTPDERGVYEDATASYEYLTRTLGVPPDRIVIFGHSLGSGVAIELATRVPAAAVIVEGAYTSIVDRGQELYPLLPIRLVASQRFSSIDRIASIAIPKLFLHSPEDTVIPFAYGQRLFETAREPKRFVSVKGGHEDAYRADTDVYYGAIDRLLNEVDPRHRVSGDASTSSGTSQ
jgi:pimeloyl-ACP methyl ester carboxylesterase